MKNKQIALRLLLGSCITCQPSHAETLSYLLELAISNEPTYLSARSNVQAANARTDQAFGGLLPQVEVTANTDYKNRDFRFRNQGNRPQQDTYNSNAQEVNITQPIWSGPAYLGLQQAKAAARDGVCYPVHLRFADDSFLNHVEILRTGQHAPSGWEI